MNTEQCACANDVLLSALNRVITTDSPDEVCSELSYHVASLLRVTRLAVENDNSGWSTAEETRGAIGDVLAVAEALQSLIIDGTEQLQRDLGKAVRKLEGRA